MDEHRRERDASERRELPQPPEQATPISTATIAWLECARNENVSVEDIDKMAPGIGAVRGYHDVEPAAEEHSHRCIASMPGCQAPFRGEQRVLRQHLGEAAGAATRGHGRGMGGKV